MMLPDRTAARCIMNRVRNSAPLTGRPTRCTCSVGGWERPRAPRNALKTHFTVQNYSRDLSPIFRSLLIERYIHYQQRARTALALSISFSCARARTASNDSGKIGIADHKLNPTTGAYVKRGESERRGEIGTLEFTLQIIWYNVTGPINSASIAVTNHRQH